MLSDEKLKELKMEVEELREMVTNTLKQNCLTLEILSVRLNILEDELIGRSDEIKIKECGDKFVAAMMSY